MAGSRVKGITIEIDGNTNGLDKALAGVNQQANRTTTELRDVNKLLKLDPGNTELVAQKQKLLSSAVETTQSKLDQLRSAQAQVDKQFESGDLGEAQYRSFQREVQATEGQLNKLKGGLGDVSKYMDGSEDASARAEAGFKNVSTAAQDTADNVDTITKLNIGEFMGGIADKAAEMGGEVISTGMDFANAQATMQTSMGMTKSQAEDAMKSVHAVFDSGLVDNVEEANTAVMTVKNSFQDLNGTDLTNMTITLQGIANRAGVDIEDAVNASSQAMKGFGVSGTEATDIVAKGLQLGLDKNHDFLDTVNEYAPTFKDAGLSGENMLNVLNAGLKNGAFNTDKVADGIKEFQLRLTSGQLDEPMQQFGQATQEVFQKFKDGGATSAEVMAAVGKDLKGMPADEAKAAVSGLGTQFEDLGQNASAALLEAATGTQNVTGASKELAKQTPGEKMQASINKLKDALSKVVAQMAPVIDWVAKLVEKFLNADPAIQTLIGSFGAVMAVIAVLLPIITSLVTIFSIVGTGAILPLIAIIGGLVGAIVIAVNVIKNWGAIGEWFATLWATIKVNFQYAVYQMSTTATAVFTSIGTFFKNVWNAIKATFTTTLNSIKTTVSNVFNSIKTFVSNTWNSIKAFFSSTWNSIKTTTTNVVNAIRTTIQTVFNAIKSFITNVFNGIKNVITSIFNAIKTFITNTVNAIRSTIQTVFNAIKSIITNIINGIKSVATSVFNAIKAVITNAVNSIRSTIQNVFNAIRSFISNVLNAIRSTVSSIWSGISGITNSVWNGIRNAISNVVNGIRDTVSNVFNSVRSIAGSIWNGISGTISGVVNGIRGTVSNVLGSLGGIASGAFDGVRNAASNVLNGALNVVRGIIDNIKGLFNFNLKFPSIDIPKIPLPHFSLSGSFNPLKGKIPSVSVDWYAKGGIFSKPTLFATGSGMKGVGEAGPEAVLPLNAETLGGIGAGIANAMGGMVNDTPTVTIQQNFYTTGDTSAREAARQSKNAMRQLGYQLLGGI